MESGKFNIESWEETTIGEADGGPKLIRASVTQSYSGDIEGKGTLEYLITISSDDFSSFIGLERFVGQLDGNSGSFVLNHEGTHEDGVAKSSFKIISGSGTDELSGIRGEGSYEATHDKVTWTLDYNFE